MTLSDKIHLIQRIESQRFIQENQKVDPVKLLLKYGNDPEKKWLAAQLAIRKKVAKKLPEWTNNSSLIFPEGVSAEQASSEETAEIKANLLNGNTLIDATGGMGVDAFYLSKNFVHTQLFEQNSALADVTKYNLNTLQSGILVHSKAFTPASIVEKIDVLYLDPARRGNENEKLIDLETYEPNVVAWLPELLKKAKKVVIKTSPMISIDLAISQLKNVSEVWVISVRNECKEVVFLCEPKPSASLVFRLLNSTPTLLENEAFTAEQLSAKANLSNHIKRYMYEPNASIMKGSAMDALANELNLLKLHPNTNFFTAAHHIFNYPGKVFEVISLHKPNDKALKGIRANVISRNYFEKADVIAGRLRIKPAKHDYLLAFSYLNEQGKEQQAFAKAKLLPR